jgi:hypothetical protein
MVDNFNSSTDTIHLLNGLDGVAHPTDDTVDGGGNLFVFNDTVAAADESHAYAQAYQFAYDANGHWVGNGSDEYVVVHETTNGGDDYTFLFAHDTMHTAVAFEGDITFSNGDIVGS